MASSEKASLAKGTFAPSTPSDSRSPCPVLNSLANHGYLPRDGRNMRPADVKHALDAIGISNALCTVLAHPIFLEHKAKDTTAKSTSFPARVLYLARNPWALFFASFGMRRPGQINAKGKNCLDLEQLAQHDIVEHDVSLTRRDIIEGDNRSPQPDLVQELLACSADGGKTFTAADLAGLRKRRIDQRREANPGLNYGAFQHTTSCAELALILDLFGDGNKIPFEYIRAVFEEERLPVLEGWKKRRWWTLGFLELGRSVGMVKKLVGLNL